MTTSSSGSSTRAASDRRGRYECRRSSPGPLASASRRSGALVGRARACTERPRLGGDLLCAHQTSGRRQALRRGRRAPARHTVRAHGGGTGRVRPQARRDGAPGGPGSLRDCRVVARAFRSRPSALLFCVSGEIPGGTPRSKKSARIVSSSERGRLSRVPARCARSEARSCCRSAGSGAVALRSPGNSSARQVTAAPWRER
jgi:hypothetical protein